MMTFDLGARHQYRQIAIQESVTALGRVLFLDVRRSPCIALGRLVTLALAAGHSSSSSLRIGPSS